MEGLSGLDCFSGLLLFADIIPHFLRFGWSKEGRWVVSPLSEAYKKGGIFKYIKVFGRKAGGLFPKAGDVLPEGGGLFPDLSFCVGKNIKEYFLFCGVSFPEDDFYGVIGHGQSVESCIMLQDYSDVYTVMICSSGINFCIILQDFLFCSLS